MIMFVMGKSIGLRRGVMRICECLCFFLVWGMMVRKGMVG